MLPKRLTTALGLRGVFTAKDTNSLISACNKLEIKIENNEQFEGEFNRYFVGPQAPIAPPYASFYLDGGGAIMGKTTQTVRELYDLMGLINPKEGSLPEDFLGLELDAYYQLLHIELTKNIHYLQSLRLHFLKEHIAMWIPLFIQAAKNSDHTPSPSLLALLDSLNAFINTELSN
ncbi:MAG: molecular chaperone TorD family protein [Campylobacteraceae bacterium]|nr:molecular chaperone TorD family protein [Campylobacteraceae bacterium]